MGKRRPKGLPKATTPGTEYTESLNFGFWIYDFGLTSPYKEEA